jgi:RNA 2',3'-cyclic 3'-phosphodiesterase
MMQVPVSFFPGSGKVPYLRTVTNATAMRRLFAAIPVVAEPALTELHSRSAAYFRQEQIRWTNPAQLHLTLKFFGEVPESSISEIGARIGEVTQRHQPFSCSLEGIGLFGSRYDPRVIWVGIAHDDLLRQLGEDLLDALALGGFPRERLPFVPHLTLGRIHHVRDKKRLNDWVKQHHRVQFQMLPVQEVVLYESILKPAGAEHTVIGRFALPSQHQ